MKKDNDKIIDRFYIRSFIMREASDYLKSKLPDEFYRPLEQTIIQSNFWRYPKNVDDLDYNLIGGEWWEQSEAAEVLNDSIQGFFDDNNFPITVIVRSPDPHYNEKWIIEKGHQAYPNRFVIGGQQGISKRGRFVMYIDMGIFGDNFDISDIDPPAVVGIIGRIIRHELIHTTHFEKRRRKQRIPRMLAKKRYEEEGEIESDTES